MSIHVSVLRHPNFMQTLQTLRMLKTFVTHFEQRAATVSESARPTMFTELTWFCKLQTEPTNSKRSQRLFSVNLSASDTVRNRG